MIGIRVDSNEIIATGHLMRCIAIALEVQRQGEDCYFLLSDEKSISQLKEYSFKYEVLNSDWKNLEGEIDKLKEVVKKKNIHYLIIDSYYASKSYLEVVDKVVPVLYIDDFGHIPYNVYAILQYVPNHRQLPDNNYNKDYTTLLRGIEYAPLREGFSIIQEQKRENRILITTGGTDNFHVTKRLIKEIKKNTFFENYEIDVVLGAMNSDEEEIAEDVLLNKNIHIYKNVKNMEELMKSAVIAISASGTTLLELCSTNTPTVCFSIADNQIDFAKCLMEQGLVRYIGDVREDAELMAQSILNVAKMLLQDWVQRRKYEEKMKKDVDGKGTQRIVHFLLKEKL